MTMALYFGRTVGFVIGFSTFLLGCIDYSRLRLENSTRLPDVIVPHCVSRSVSLWVLNELARPTLSRFSGFTLLLFLLFSAFYAWQIFNFITSIRRLVVMYNFYSHLLKIPDVCSIAIRYPSIELRDFDTGRYPDNRMARSCTEDWGNPRRKPYYCNIF